MSLVALWVIALALISATALVAWGYGVSAQMRYAGYAQEQFDQPQFAWDSVLGILAAPLLVTSLLAVMMALVAHSVLWRRARLTPSET